MHPRANSIPRHPSVGAYEPPSLARTLLLAVALFALTLPIVGPLEDQHFVERSHAHGHVYMDGRAASHQHVFELSARHWHAAEFRTDGADDYWPIVSSTVYFTDPTVGMLLAVMNAPSHHAPQALRPTAPRGDGSNPLAGCATMIRQPAGRDIAPLPPPPIA